MVDSSFSLRSQTSPSWREWPRSIVPIATALLLLAMAIANIVQRATTDEVEDGVLWVERNAGVVAAEVAPGSAAHRAGVKPGDVLLALDGAPVTERDQVLSLQFSARAGDRHSYTLLRLGTREVAQVTLEPIPSGTGGLYFVLAAVGIFALLVGVAVRTRRPYDQATLHFFWLAVAFFGTFTFSFTGRFDRVDWFFYWADVVALLLVPPLFLHFTLVFPERPHSQGYTALLARWLPTIYLPAAVLGSTRVLALVRAEVDPDYFVRLISLIDTLELVHLTAYLGAGLLVLVRALRKVRSVTSTRQLRWIVWGTALGVLPFTLGYTVPFVFFGVDPSLPMELLAIPFALIPLAFASAIVRYRLMDVEVILKRLLVYTAVLAAIAAIYVLILRTSGGFLIQTEDEHRWLIAFLATVIVLLLARPVKEAVQSAIDRAFYRDRYDYRRALVAFARDLNGDLDLNRLSDRLVSRIKETFVVDRMALMSASETGDFEPVRVAGFDSLLPRLSTASGIGGRLANGHAVRLDDPLAVGRFTAEEVELWRDAGIYYLIPCISNDRVNAVFALGRRETGEPLTSEDMNLLTAVAGQAATAIENGRLYRQLHLKASELDRLRTFNENILESLDDGLLVVGLDDRVIRWNQALERMYGITRADALGQPLERLFDAPFVEAIRAGRTKSPHGTSLFRVPIKARTAEALGVLVNVTMVPLQAVVGADAQAGTIVILEDITERAELEEQLRISEKMASLGLLAAGVAHEVNTPLTGISSFTQMLLEQADPSDPRTKVLEKIEKQTFRAARIVNGLLTLSRPSAAEAAERAPVDLNKIIGDVLSLLEHQLEKGSIKIRRELSAGSVPIEGYEFKLQQVFLNLLLNARDAMPSGGWLTIATRIEHGDAVAEVSDTGSGIPPEHLARIYDPFFTTKATGQGTGLGLSIAYGIVREHDGTIHCDSVPGQGTRFALRFKTAAVHPTAIAR